MVTRVLPTPREAARIRQELESTSLSTLYIEGSFATREELITFAQMVGCTTTDTPGHPREQYPNTCIWSGVVMLCKELLGKTIWEIKPTPKVEW